MTLLAYAPLANVPAEVTVANAEDYLPFEVFERAMAVGRNIQVLSDVIRGVWLWVNEGGWLLDGDCIALQPFPEVFTKGEPFFGNFMASMDADPRTGPSKEDEGIFWQLNYLSIPGVRVYTAKPYAFCKHSLVLRDYLLMMLTTVVNLDLEDLEGVEWAKSMTSWKEHNHEHYNISMQAMQKAFVDTGQTGSIVDPKHCSPFAYSLGKKVVSKKHRIDVDKVVQSAICVNNFIRLAKGSMAVVEVGSPLDMILDHIEIGGGKWKKIKLTKRSPESDVPHSEGSIY